MHRIHKDYGLDWIDQEALFEITEKIFRNAITKVSNSNFAAPPDPFSIAAQAVLLGQSASSMNEFEKLRAANKTISNAVGNYHQAVLGLAPGWENQGTSGGVVDLIVHDKETLKPIYVEVKNRYNTIKASDEKELWDRLETLARANATTSYLIQIVPETKERYDRAWKVSGRIPRESVRVIDGATAYAWAFGKETALAELYEAFPDILADVLGRDYDKAGMFAFYLMSMPK